MELPWLARVWASVASREEKGVSTTTVCVRSAAGMRAVRETPVGVVIVAPEAMSILVPPVRVKLTGPPERSKREVIWKLPSRPVVTVPRGTREPSDWYWATATDPPLMGPSMATPETE